jgi:hypothetical protein
LAHRSSCRNFDERVVLLVHGDSIPVVSDYPAKLAALIRAAQPGNVEVYNQAVGGAGFITTTYTSTMIASAPVVIDPIIRTHTPSRRVVLIIDAGTNDIWLSGQSAAATYAALETYVLARIAAGLPASDIYVQTMLPRSHGDAGVAAFFEVIRQDFITLVVAGAGTHGYGLIRRDLDTDIGDFGDEQNATNYGDMIHLNSVAGGNGAAALTYAGLYP